jgi:hypothetical protein
VSRLQVQVVIAIAVAVFAIGIITSGGKVQVQWLKFYSVAVLAATLLLGIWERFLWHIGPAQRLKSVPRDVRGTWKGEMASKWVPDGKRKPAPAKPVYLVIRQTFSTVSVRLISDEGGSKSSLGRLLVADHQAKLDYMYLNEPHLRVEPRSRMHHGATSLEVIGRPVTRLTGRFWTDRETQGTLELTEHSSKIAEDFASAARLFT